MLPTFNATLRTCPVGPAAFTPHPQGSFCRQCQRVVQDFSQSENPVADLAAARAAAPDGRVCGRFHTAQVQRPQLTQRLRWFVLALVMVVGQGLNAHEALAQVRKAVPVRRASSIKKTQPSQQVELLGYVGGSQPSFQGSGDPRAVVKYIQKHIVWPPQCTREHIYGRIFVKFKVDTLGRVHDVQLLKVFHPLLDDEVLRVVRALPNFIPAMQEGRPVESSLTVPLVMGFE